MTRQPGPPRAVHFDIGRVTLHGYSPGQQARFVSSLQARLAGLAAGRGYRWPTAAQRIGHLDAGVLQAGAAPEEAAERVAASLFAAVVGGRPEGGGRPEANGRGEGGGRAEANGRGEGSRRADGSRPADGSRRAEDSRTADGSRRAEDSRTAGRPGERDD